MEAGDQGEKNKCLWKPNPSCTTNFDVYRDQVNRKYGLKLVSYEDVYKWSVEHYPQFWEEVWRFSNLKYSQPYQEVIDESLNIAAIPKWFGGSRLNFAENLLGGDDEKVAVYAAMEGGLEIRRHTYGELRRNVACLAAAMRWMGVKAGDRVAGYLPNCTEAVECMLAAASIGAIWSSTSPEFGVTGVLDRFTQISPRLLFSVNAVVYNGKTHNHMDKLEAVVQGLDDLEKVIVLHYVGDAACDITHIKHGCLYNEFLSSALGDDGSPPALTFEQLPFEHPLYIMYSSGTTGVPKCLVHSAGGTLLKHFEEHLLQGNLQKDDIMLYYTTTGWMMWNWLVSCLAVGASIVCYDGSPLVPSASVLWDLIDTLGITVLGTGAKWLSVLEEKGVRPKTTHSLTSLHSILSTGSPLSPHTYDYVYRDVKRSLILGSITGGTDIIGCFAGQSWDVPVFRGEIQCRFLGMAVESWDEDGRPVHDSSGELVCTKPFPSMPVYFWRDSDGEKYRRAYFDKFEGVWAHGDFCSISSKTGGVCMLGRSDGTLNPNGVRFGSAEVYHVVEAFEEIQDSLCVAQKNRAATEERAVLFLKMAPGSLCTDDLVKRVKTSIRSQLSARHVPAVVLETRDIPYTNSGKKVEIAVKRIIGGEEVKVRGAYANPDSLDLYRDIPQLTGY